MSSLNNGMVRTRNSLKFRFYPSLISTDNQWLTLNALADQDTDCLHPNGVLLLLSLPALRKLNIQKSSDDLALVMSVKAFVDSATI